MILRIVLIVVTLVLIVLQMLLMYRMKKWDEDAKELEKKISRKLKMYGRVADPKKKMTLNEYQALCLSTSEALGVNEDDRFIIASMGVAGEAGEVVEKVKKLLRDYNGVMTDDFKEKLVGEIGDVMWYCAVLTDEVGYDLCTVSHKNIDKTLSRLERGVIAGNGDNR